MSMKWKLKPGHFVSILMIAIFLSGCSGGQFNDLQTYIDDIKSSSKGRIEPLPEFVPVENFTYAVSDFGDPFMSWETKAVIAAKAEQKASVGGGGLQPDLGRRREPLEAYPLDTLRMVGTLEKGGQSSALVQSPDGLVSRIMMGNYLGQNYGQVVSIGSDQVELIEIVPDGLGSWIKRPATLAIVE